jgi:hypothetical protein
MPPPRPRFHLPRLRALPVLGAAACVAVLWGLSLAGALRTVG